MAPSSSPRTTLMPYPEIPVQESLSRSAVPVIQGYGMTELSPASHADFVDHVRNRPGSVGRFMADTEEMIVDVETGETEVAPGVLIEQERGGGVG